jgi:hypothetical protein
MAVSVTVKLSVKMLVTIELSTRVVVTSWSLVKTDVNVKVTLVPSDVLVVVIRLVPIL